MRLSKYAIETMGYSEHSTDDELLVRFGILRTYTMEGIGFDENCDKSISKIFNFGDHCTVAISESINEASQLLIGDVYTENEKDWILEKKTKPPFVLIYFKESSDLKLNGGYRMMEGEQIHTYDAFTNKKLEIKQWEKATLPSIVTALTVHFSATGDHIKLIPVDRNIFGRTKEGKILLDLKVSGKIEVSLSKSKKLNEINLSLQNSLELFFKLDEKTSRHIYMALAEPDRFKKYLYLFLFIERYTHRKFLTMNFDSDAKGLINIPSRLKKSGNIFFKERQSDAKNLTQRFHWCAIIIWKELNDQDIEDFKEIKKIRDKISHGEDVNEVSLPVDKVLKLAFKLLKTK